MDGRVLHYPLPLLSIYWPQVQILMEVAERDNSAAVRAAAMQAVQCCPLEVLFTMETQTSSSNMMMRLLNRLCDVGSTVCERAGSGMKE